MKTVSSFSINSDEQTTCERINFKSVITKIIHTTISTYKQKTLDYSYIL